ncbi:MAG: GTPase HflX [Proteobacteria bacterium]|nr:GTPase HflX [Pseudomonadota bacterium]
MNENKKILPRAILVGITLPDGTEAETEASLIELGRLVKTLGYDVASTLTQRRGAVGGGLVLGEGKLKALAERTGGLGHVPKRSFAKKTKAALRREKADEEASRVASQDDLIPPEFEDDDAGDDAGDGAGGPEGAPEKKVDAVVFDCELTPSQLANLEKATGVRVYDRTGVIVEIFSRHARTREARLQVEIARLKYLSPRVRVTGSGPEDRMGRAGESSLELDRRRIRDRIAALNDEIAAVQREQAEGRAQRARERCVALVGYTNAGKSSLMRALTGSEVLVEDKLFATLDTTVRTLVPPSVPPILVSDTVGFIKKLPHDLVASFRSTLEEAKNAGLLLFVVDAADPAFRDQLAVTHEVLSSIGVADVASRLVLNKCDKLTVDAIALLRTEFPEAIFISTRRPEDVADLRERIVAFFEAGMVEEEVFVAYAETRRIGPIRASLRVLGERHDENGTWLRVRGHAPDIARLREER